jgi:hypothetical protein
MNELALFAGGGGESLQDICSDGELCVPLKSKITHAEFYCNGKLMDSYLDSLSGMIFVHSMENLGQEKSMSSQEDFHAQTFQQPNEMPKELMEKNQDSGKKWQGWLAKLDQDSYLWKTAQCSLIEDLDEYLQTFPRSGMTQNGLLWDVPSLEQNIKETESGLWGTPTTSQDFKPIRKLAPSEANGTHGKILVGSIGKEHPHLIGRYLKPLVTEYLMGWPIGWTDLEPLEMDKFHFVPQQLGES